MLASAPLWPTEAYGGSVAVRKGPPEVAVLVFLVLPTVLSRTEPTGGVLIILGVSPILNVSVIQKHSLYRAELLTVPENPRSRAV